MQKANNMIFINFLNLSVWWLSMQTHQQEQQTFRTKIKLKIFICEWCMRNMMKQV
jgi:hypothetical protein